MCLGGKESAPAVPAVEISRPVTTSVERNKDTGKVIKVGADSAADERARAAKAKKKREQAASRTGLSIGGGDGGPDGNEAGSGVGSFGGNDDDGGFGGVGV